MFVSRMLLLKVLPALPADFNGLFDVADVGRSHKGTVRIDWFPIARVRLRAEMAEHKMTAPPLPLVA